MPTIDNIVCRNITGYETVNNEMMCAGYLSGGKDSCEGDSGGPLFYKLKSGLYSQVGIVSTGMSCAKPNQPGIYTRLASFIKWIENNTQI